MIWHLLATPVAIGGVLASASGQVSVQVVTHQPLHLQAQVVGGPLQTLTVPAGTNITNSGVLQAQSVFTGGGGLTALTITPTTSASGTTCELVASAFFSTIPTMVAFSSHESGQELVTFSSPVPIGGVLVAEAEFDPSSGPAVGNATLAADFAFDGSVELTAGFGGPARYGRPWVLGPGQDFTVHVAHQGALAGPQVGEYSTRITLRFVPHANGYDLYGPAIACKPTAFFYFLNGTAILAVGLSSPPVDAYVLAVGHNQVSLPMPFPSSCPLLSSADLVFGPLAGNTQVLPPASIPAGADVYLQFVGLRFATLTADASLGIHGYGL